MESETKIDTYRYNPLNNFCYLATVAGLSEDQIEILKSSRSAQNRLEEWKSELKEFTNCPPILRMGQFEVHTRFWGFPVTIRSIFEAQMNRKR